MSLGSRLALAFALVAVLVAATVGALSYQAASLRVMREIDRSLEVAATAVAAGQTRVLDPPIVDVWSGPRPGVTEARRTEQDQSLVAQLVAPDGTVTPLGGRDVTLPADPARALSPPAARGQLRVDEVVVEGETYRILTTGLGDARGALQVGVDIDISRRVLTGLGDEVLVTSVAVALVAAGAGWLLSRRTTRPLAQLADASERVTASGPDGADVPQARGSDEVARLATSFRTMLRRLAETRETQERLVQDAAHELRTPLTSLRTNARVLRRLDDLTPESRAKLVADLEGETRELSDLVDELVALALTRRTVEVEEDLDLGELAGRVGERLSRRTGREVVHAVEGEVIVRGRRAALERAVGNLVENAAKFDHDGTEPIGIAVRDGSVAVSDRGPGLPEDATERIFDRFHRAEEARALPGSGLGLAIVRDVALAHDGRVFAGNRPDGGSTVGFAVGRARLTPSSHLRHADDSHSPTTLGVQGERAGTSERSGDGADPGGSGDGAAGHGAGTSTAGRDADRHDRGPA